MSDRITDKDLVMKLLNHNAWTNGTILDLDSLGAGGSRLHLIHFNTQKYLGHLMTNRELWDLISSIGNYEYSNGLQRKTPIKVFQDEYDRLANGGKLNHSFMYDLRPSGSGYGKPIKGHGFKKNILKSIESLKSSGEIVNRSYEVKKDD